MDSTIRPQNCGLGSTEHWAHTIKQLSLCGRQLRRMLGDVTIPWNLSDTEFLMLWICNEGVDEGVAQNDLASSLGVSSAQMSGLVYDLRDRGLLTLERPIRDRRRQLLHITGSGQLLLNRVTEAMAPLISELEAGVTREDHGLLTRIMSRLIEVTKARPCHPASNAANALGTRGSNLELSRDEVRPIRRAS